MGLITIRHLVNTRLRVVTFTLNRILTNVTNFLLPKRNNLKRRLLGILILNPVSLMTTNEATCFLPNNLSLVTTLGHARANRVKNNQLNVDNRVHPATMVVLTTRYTMYPRPMNMANAKT